MPASERETQAMDDRAASTQHNRPIKTVPLLHPWREELLTFILRVVLVLALPIISADFITSVQTGAMLRIGCNILVLVVLLPVALFPQIRYRVRVAVLLTLLYLLATGWLIAGGLIGTGRLYFFALLTLAALLLDYRGTFVTWGVGLVTMAAVYAGFATEALPLPLAIVDRMFAPATLLTNWLVQVTITISISGVILMTVNRLQQSLQEAETARADLQRLNAELAQRVAEGTTARRESQALLNSFINNSPAIISAKDLEGRIILTNRWFESIFQGEPGTFLGKTDQDFLSPAVVADNQARERVVIQSAMPVQYEEVIAGITFMAIKFPLYDDAGRMYGTGDIAYDISRRKQIEQDLRHKVQELNALRATLAEMSGELELDRLLRSILKRAVDLLNGTEGELSLYDTKRGDLSVLVCYNMEQDFTGRRVIPGEGAVGYVARTQKPLIIDNYLLWPDRVPAYEEMGSRALVLVPMLTGQQLVGVIVVGDDRPDHIFTDADVKLLTLFAQQAAIAIQNAQLFAEVQRLATIDPLTGLYNRRSFFNLAQRTFDQIVRYDRSLSVLLLDIDHFKRVNDTYGHQVGDQVLQAVAYQCRTALRNVDIIGRYGGEEIIIVLPETTSAGAYLVADRLCRSLAQMPVQTDRGTVGITVSLGVATFDQTEMLSLELLIDRADQSLYAAKRSGRNRVVVWDEII